MFHDAHFSKIGQLKKALKERLPDPTPFSPVSF